jgi:hypothetical protein
MGNGIPMLVDSRERASISVETSWLIETTRGEGSDIDKEQNRRSADAVEDNDK